MTTIPASCLCGHLRISFLDYPLKRMLCHCLDCRKITGSNYSDNGVVADAQFTLVSGTPNTFTKPADSGLNVTIFFCPQCGTTAWSEGEWLPGVKIVKLGIVDDVEWQSRTRPEGELYGERRMEWLGGLGRVCDVRGKEGEEC